MLTSTKSADLHLILKIVLPIVGVAVVWLVCRLWYREWRIRRKRHSEGNCLNAMKETSKDKRPPIPLHPLDLDRPWSSSPEDLAEPAIPSQFSNMTSAISASHEDATLRQRSSVLKKIEVVLPDPISDSEESDQVFSGNSLRLPMPF